MPSRKVSKTVYVKQVRTAGVYREAANYERQRAMASAIIGIGLGIGLNSMMRGSGGGHHHAARGHHQGGHMRGMR